MNLLKQKMKLFRLKYMVSGSLCGLVIWTKRWRQPS